MDKGGQTENAWQLQKQPPIISLVWNSHPNITAVKLISCLQPPSSNSLYAFLCVHFTSWNTLPQLCWPLSNHHPALSWWDGGVQSMDLGLNPASTPAWLGDSGEIHAQFLHPDNRDNKSSCFIGLSGRLNELIDAKWLQWSLAHNRWILSDRCHPFCYFIHSWTLEMHLMHLPSASPISQTQELFLIPVSVAPDPWWRLCSSAPPPAQDHLILAVPGFKRVCKCVTTLLLNEYLSYLCHQLLIVSALTHQLHFSSVLIICLPSSSSYTSCESSFREPIWLFF